MLQGKEGDVLSSPGCNGQNRPFPASYFEPLTLYGGEVILYPACFGRAFGMPRPFRVTVLTIMCKIRASTQQLYLW